MGSQETVALTNDGALAFRRFSLEVLSGPNQGARVVADKDELVVAYLEQRAAWERGAVAQAREGHDAVQAVVDLGGLRVRDAHIQTGASETDLKVSKPNMERCEEFKLEVGAADFSAEGLGNLNCASYDVNGGVGDVTLDFNGAWRVDTDVKVDMGLGQLTLVLPRGLGVKVEKGGFLASFDSEGLIKRGNAYYSENWEKAGNRVSFNIDAAFGAIRIQWVEPEAEFRRAQR